MFANRLIVYMTLTQSDMETRLMSKTSLARVILNLNVSCHVIRCHSVIFPFFPPQNVLTFQGDRQASHSHLRAVADTNP